MLRRLVTLLVLLAFAPWLVAPALAQPEPSAVGKVVDQRGAVTVMRQDRPVALIVGAPVFRRDQIHTGAASRVKLELVDGTVLAIGSGSQLTVAEYVTDASQGRLEGAISLLLGILRATVANGSSPGAFDVESRAAVASVRSTDFVMEATDGHCAVFVVEGRVEVSQTSAGAGQGVSLDPGQGTDVETGSPPTEPKMWGQGRVDEFLARTRIR